MLHVSYIFCLKPFESSIVFEKQMISSIHYKNSYNKQLTFLFFVINVILSKLSCSQLHDLFYVMLFLWRWIECVYYFIMIWWNKNWYWVLYNSAHCIAETYFYLYCQTTFNAESTLLYIWIRRINALFKTSVKITVAYWFSYIKSHLWFS